MQAGMDDAADWEDEYEAYEDVSVQNAGSRDDEGGTDDWDLEDALAEAILGDLTSEKVFPVAAWSRDDAAEEQLIDKLHAQLFPREIVDSQPPKRVSLQKKTSRSLPHKAKSRGKKTAAASPVQPPEPPTRRSISSEKVEQMLARFGRHESERARHLQQLHRESVSSSASSTASYRPVLSPGSVKLTRAMPTFHQRQAAFLAKKQRELACRRQHEAQQRDLSQSLGERVRTPCICGSGSNDVQQHTAACHRFMDMCEKMNASSEIQRKKAHMRRSVDDMMRFQEEKERKKRTMVAAQRQKEEREATFTPQINPTSMKIYEQLKESGRLQRDASGSPVKSPPGPQAPSLSKMSTLVLHQAGKQPHVTQRRRSSSVASRASISSLKYQRRSSQSLLPKAASFSESHWLKQAQLARPTSPEPLSPAIPAFTPPWTTVTYSPRSARFILNNFDLPACYLR